MRVPQPTQHPASQQARSAYGTATATLVGSVRQMTLGWQNRFIEREGTHKDHDKLQ
jgi:hypothetical protein